MVGIGRALKKTMYWNCWTKQWRKGIVAAITHTLLLHSVYKVQQKRNTKDTCDFIETNKMCHPCLDAANTTELGTTQTRHQ